MNRKTINITGLDSREVASALISVGAEIAKRRCRRSGEAFEGTVVVAGESIISWAFNPDPCYEIEPELLQNLEYWNGNLNNIEVALRLLRDADISDLDAEIEVVAGLSEDEDDPRTGKFLSIYDSMCLCWGAESADEVKLAYETLEGEGL